MAWRRIAAALVACAPAIAGACTPDLPGGSVERLESARFAVAFRTRPERVAVGRHFDVEFAICARDGRGMPEGIRLDAQMPEHRHGMNYRPAIRAEAPGRYRAEGLMFHMPGRWEYLFELRSAGVTDRLARSVVLE